MAHDQYASRSNGQSLDALYQDLQNAHRQLVELLERFPGERARDVDRRRRFAQQIYKTRRLRSRFFPDELFAEPAWDILLLLYGEERSPERLSLSAVCASAGAPHTTVLRWIQKLVEADMIIREKHPSDGRIYLLHLADHTTAALDAFFDQALDKQFRDGVGAPDIQIH